MEAIRRPAAAGQFYPDSRESLSKDVASLLDKVLDKEDAIGVVSPHAGYVYSGRVAGMVLSSIRPKPTYIIMGPNHTGMGERFSVSVDNAWKTPLGDVRIDKALAAAIRKNSRHVKEDNLAHTYEHSIEVQLPILQVLQTDFRFVPIVISHGDSAIYREIGKALAASVKEARLASCCTIIASSDMTHYESSDSAEKKDRKAIEAILELDEEKLIDVVENFDISMCGYAPIAIMLVAAKELGARSARLIKYQTSGDASGDYSSVVGYAGITIV